MKGPLATSPVIAFIPTRNPQKARQFFEETLGLRFVSEDPFAMVFDANGVTLRVASVSIVKDFKPQPFAILGWNVANIESTARELSCRGIRFERFDGLNQNDLHIWKSPSGAQVAWFKDPDGNILSITQF